MPMDEDYYCEFNDDAFDLVTLDEYRTQKKLVFLNAFTDGVACNLKRKGLTGYVHARYVPCLIFSNYSWDNSYCQAAKAGNQSLVAAKRRWKVVEVDQSSGLLRYCAWLNTLSE